MPDTTLLQLTGVGVPPYSARGLTQTLEPIGQASQLRRTVNGALIDVSAPQFRKYRSTITCNDQQAPAVNGIWPGMVVVVDCVATLSYVVGGSADRTIVPGSSYVDSGFVIYRPRLTMRVVSHNQSKDEYGAVTNWNMELEEV